MALKMQTEGFSEKRQMLVYLVMKAGDVKRLGDVILYYQYLLAPWRSQTSLWPSLIMLIRLFARCAS